MCPFIHKVLVLVVYTLLSPPVGATIRSHVNQGPNETTLLCTGYNHSAVWEKVVNGSGVSIATINGSIITMNDTTGSFSVKSKSGKSGLVTTLTTANNNTGPYRCRVGLDSKLLHIKLPITVNSTGGECTLSMTCSPKNGGSTILWFLNSTQVSVIRNYVNGTTAVIYKNSSFVELGNYTYDIQTNTSHYNGTRPACLTCVVSTNTSYGDSTRCTLYTKDLTRKNETEFLHYLDFMYGENDESETFNEESKPTGVPLLVTTCVLIALILLFVFLIHRKGKNTRKNIYTAPRTDHTNRNERSTRLTTLGVNANELGIL
ncbi:a120.1 [Rat cytomegalovirus ALL-03]|uniref:A120.1 n=2 Tax=Rat cytomegalovirus (isolate England) TaxID=1261657 RepID=A0A0F6R580_RCMVE|nr:e120.1 [Murid betaherpesvirus 8]AKE44281.1 a120.1 [Rat cytomegalovirus ALL-03]AFX83430.1 e120.1 [Murid betaherpesvirus 8]WEG71902.1 membrane protein m120.1 [Murid betaherpesvirus 8]WPH25292.1 membrane protein m120.1 [Murid betaherpesvirus 8]WPH25425.1 membrane protein m120.1 [Murid betaherpesvirus 8]